MRFRAELVECKPTLRRRQPWPTWPDIISKTPRRRNGERTHTQHNTPSSQPTVGVIIRV